MSWRLWFAPAALLLAAAFVAYVWFPIESTVVSCASCPPGVLCPTYCTAATTYSTNPLVYYFAGSSAIAAGLAAIFLWIGSHRPSE